MYLDPPYWLESKLYGEKGDLNFQEKDHLELFKILSKSILKNFLNIKLVATVHAFKSKQQSVKNYDVVIKVNKNISHEKLFRRDKKYDFFIPINYNTRKPKIPNGSAIFIHLTNNYKPTLGCVALREKDFLILVSLINKNTKIQII